MEHERAASDVRYTAETFRATERAMGRAASGVHEDFAQGLNTLATTASVAPLFGVLGTVLAICFDTFKGIGTEKSTVMAMVVDGLARACVPTALGLLIGLQSLWAYRYLRGRLAEADREMAGAPLSCVPSMFDSLRVKVPLTT